MVSDDRGQLILIGAIAISLILIGLVLVVNTALFTQVVGTEGTVEMTKEAGVAAAEIEGGASALVHAENVDSTGDAPTDFDGSHVSDDLDAALRNESLNGAGAFVNVTYAGNPSEGTYLYQDDNNTIESSSSGDIEIPDASMTEIGFARVGISLSDSNTGENTTIAVTGSGGTTETLDIEYTSAGVITLETPATTPTTCTIENAGDFVWIDLRTGFDYTEQCQFDLFDRVEGPYSLEFRTDGNDLNGEYDVVVSEDIPGGTDACDLVGGCTDAIWSYELTYTYDTDEVTADAQSREVYVYD